MEVMENEYEIAKKPSDVEEVHRGALQEQIIQTVVFERPGRVHGEYKFSPLTPQNSKGDVITSNR
jgi:hypothetical protein